MNRLRARWVVVRSRIMEAVTQAGWYADPSGEHAQRWWDGTGWTRHVSGAASAPRPAQSTLEAPGARPSPTPTADPAMGATIRRSEEPLGDGTSTAVVTPAPVASGSVGAPLRPPPRPAQAPVAGGGTLFDEPVLVVSQKAKLIELNTEYHVADQHGAPLGAVREVGQSGLARAARLLTSFDQFMTHVFHVVDRNGVHQLTVTRPAKFVKSRVIIADPSGGEIGTVVQENVLGRIRFSLRRNGERIGSIHAENWRAWNFSIRDHDDREIARITKTLEGLAKALFTTADNYVVQLHRPLEQPLASLVVASSLCVDTALKQDARGLN